MANFQFGKNLKIVKVEKKTLTLRKKMNDEYLLVKFTWKI